MLIVTLVGLLFARRLASRVARLSVATRKVASGDLDVAVPTRSRDEIGQLSSAFNDMVAELRRNRAQIAYLQKISAWQEVARRLAHEIKNPLTPILLAMQQVQEKYHGDDARYRRLLDEAAEIVKEEIDGLRRLVEAFSAFAKLPSVQPEDVDVDDLLDDFLRSRGVLEELGEVDCEPPRPAFQVRVDKLLFRRVLYNLVENAFQAAAELGRQPRVEIRARRLPHSGVGLITVTDNGPGIPDELRDRIFDPYFTTKNVGTGLGLAIVKKIILEHSGSIDVEPGPGGGARFTIRVPTTT
jgi:nitrogen fixation/metabolism regulation signal transduction histidine kinase